MADALDPPIVAILRLVGGSSGLACGAALAFRSSLALAISAKVQVPFYPAPIALQTLVVLARSSAEQRYGG